MKIHRPDKSMMLKNRILYFLSATALVVALCSVVSAQKWSADEDFFATADEVAEWRVKASQGDPFAQYNLGQTYRHGAGGVDKNKREAVRWWRTAAEQGHADAQFKMGESYAAGVYSSSTYEDIVVKDKREAMRWYRKAAAQGSAEAQHALGWAYAYGEEVAVDKQEALRWFLQAADQDAWAQFRLGLAYWNGKTLAKDEYEAVRWFKKAAKQGHAWAQSNLGYAYANGIGVYISKQTAASWYHKSAEQGHTISQLRLGHAYLTGAGVIVDPIEAYIWQSIATVGGAGQSGLWNLLASDFDGDSAISELLSVTDWSKYLSYSEIRAAQKEAKRRLEEINRRVEESKKKTTATTNIVTAPKPKGDNPATHVFENTWRSVVVVVSRNSQGSGVIVRPNIVATNCHVIESGADITVYKATERRADTDTAFTATIRRSNRDKDFCLLDVKNLWGVVATVRKYETLRVGENVYGLGAPQGFDLSLSDGVISQLREIDGARFIQTNVAISPGSSGGGLFDRDGNLIGITTAKITNESTEGIGFAIPADLVLGN